MSRSGVGNMASLRGGAGGGGKQQQQQQGGLRHSHAGSNANSPRTSNAAQQQQQQQQAPPNPATAQGGVKEAVLKALKTLSLQPVKLTLDDGRTETGLLWSYDLAMDIVALEVPRSAASALGQVDVATAYPMSAAAFPTAKLSSVKVAAQGGDASGARTTFHIIKLRRVERVEGADSSAAQALAAAKPTTVQRDINVAAAEARERAATAEALKRVAKIGVGVSKLAQDVFDGVSKTMPARWADRHIIVLDEFVISPDKYDTVTVPDVPSATLQALAEGKDVSGAPDNARSQAMRWQRVVKVLEGERKKLQLTRPA